MKVRKHNIFNRKKNDYTLNPVIIGFWIALIILAWFVFSKLQTGEWGSIALKDISSIGVGIFPGLLFFDKEEVSECNSIASNRFDILCLFCWNIAVMVFREFIAIGTGAFLGLMDGVTVLAPDFLLVESMIIVFWFLVIPAVFITSPLIWLLFIEIVMVFTGIYYICMEKYIININYERLTPILLIAVLIAGIVSYIISYLELKSYCK